MLFTDTAPKSAYWTPPKVASGATKTKLALLGYRADGQQNTFGKITSWIPGLGVALNKQADFTAERAGLTDVNNNIDADMDNRLQKLQTALEVGKTAFGAVTGNPALIQSGVQGITQGISGTIQAQDDPDEMVLRGNTMYRTFSDGGSMHPDGYVIYPEHDKTTEDMLMIDKATGEKVGEMRYGERIFDQHATQKIEELADKGDDKALGKFLRKELATHSDRLPDTGQLFAGGGKPEPKYRREKSDQPWYTQARVLLGELPTFLEDAASTQDPSGSMVRLNKRAEKTLRTIEAEKEINKPNTVQELPWYTKAGALLKQFPSFVVETAGTLDPESAIIGADNRAAKELRSQLRKEPDKVSRTLTYAVNKPTYRTPNDTPAQTYAKYGTDFTRDWFRKRALREDNGLVKGDTAVVDHIPDPMVDSNKKLAYSFRQAGGVTPAGAGPAGFYNPNNNQTHIANDLGNDLTQSVAAHEATHAAQDILGRLRQNVQRTESADGTIKEWVLPNSTISSSYNTINQEVKRAGKPRDGYYSSPEEIHARIMQMRQDMYLQPGDKVDESAVNQLIKRGKPEYYEDLEGVLDKKGIIELLNKTVFNDKPINDGTFRAYDGGMPLPGSLSSSANQSPFSVSSMNQTLSGPNLGFFARLFNRSKRQAYRQLSDDKANDLYWQAKAASGGVMAFGPSSQQYFAGGGKPKRTSNSAIRREQVFLKGQGLYSGAIDGILGPKTRAARDAYHTKAGTYSKSSAPSSSMATIASGVNSQIATPAWMSRPESAIKPISQKGLDPKLVKPFVNTKGATAEAAATEEEGGSTDWWGLGSDALRGITAAIGAAQPLPNRPVNPELQREQRELEARSNEGLSAGERVNLLRQQAAAQAGDMAAIQNAAGGGGSAAAVLSAINRAGERSAAMGSQIEEADRSQRAINKQNYYNDLVRSQQGSDMIYTQQYNTALANKNAFTQAMMANLQNASDRQQYNKSYGEGSPYYNLMLQLMKRTGKQFNFADAPVTAGALTPTA